MPPLKLEPLNNYETSSMRAFFIFNPTFGLLEEEHYKKIIYYHPADAEPTMQQNNVGICEALINLTKNFTATKCDFMKTKKARWTFYSPETNYWMILITQNPCADKKDANTTSGDSVGLGTSQILKKMYQQYRLFNGSFERTLKSKGGKAELFRTVSAGFSEIVERVDVEDFDILETLNGVSFLYLSAFDYLRTVNCMHTIESKFDAIKYSLCLYKEYVMWTGLQRNETKRDMQHKITETFTHGFDTLQDGSNTTAPTIYIGEQDDPYKLVVYYDMHVALIFLVSPQDVSKALYEDLKEALQPRLEFLSNLGNQHIGQAAFEGFLYIYVNKINLLLETSLEPRTLELNRYVNNILLDMHEELEGGVNGVIGEYVKIYNNVWIVGQRNDYKEFYVILKNAKSLDSAFKQAKYLSRYKFQSAFMS
ncbi:vacuolar fusion protein CCZ1 homolog isoform X2 [Schistocerca gregaria]|uniref:vacuolar fusion protein CCZ1 homolog isoform X2 n=1 Tax=Schistocerca gregaria TaxID=7010 RepID=UPI00211E2CAA|nr:vacuolar fusion protein CCZ1 homolog isoform X2 [Schistocerca gregaria]